MVDVREILLALIKRHLRNIARMLQRLQIALCGRRSLHVEFNRLQDVVVHNLYSSDPSDMGQNSKELDVNFGKVNKFWFRQEALGNGGVKTRLLTLCLYSPPHVSKLFSPITT